MIVHLYTFKQIGWKNLDGVTRDTRVRLLCTKLYVPYLAGPESKAVTVVSRVTCPECLKILIPLEEARLNEMRANLFNALEALGGAQ